MHKRTLLYSLIVSALLTTSVAHAQNPAPAPSADLNDERREMDQLRDQMRELSRKMADLSQKVGDVGPRAYAYRYLGNPGRGMVGLVLEPDEHGLRVKAVTPGSPSDKAGIRNNDIIVAIDGKPASGEKGDSAIHGVSLGDVKVDQTVKLRILRDGKTNEYSVKAERRDPYNFAYAFSDNGELSKLGTLNAEAWSKEVQDRVKAETDVAMQKAQVYAQAGKRIERSLGQMNLMTPWWGLNLASLNPDLGAYFGTDKGVLVLSADDEDFKQLKSGDVVQEVAGTKVERPEDAFRVLREQKAGSSVKVDVLRQHKPMTLSLRAPDSANIFVPPPPPVPPVSPGVTIAPISPTPPAPPAAPYSEDDKGSV